MWNDRGVIPIQRLAKALVLISTLAMGGPSSTVLLESSWAGFGRGDSTETPRKRGKVNKEELWHNTHTHVLNIIILYTYIKYQYRFLNPVLIIHYLLIVCVWDFACWSIPHCTHAGTTPKTWQEYEVPGPGIRGGWEWACYSHQYNKLGGSMKIK